MTVFNTYDKYKKTLESQTTFLVFTNQTWLLSNRSQKGIKTIFFLDKPLQLSRQKKQRNYDHFTFYGKNNEKGKLLGSIKSKCFLIHWHWRPAEGKTFRVNLFLFYCTMKTFYYCRLSYFMHLGKNLIDIAVQTFRAFLLRAS
jgi:hypothetical protein